MQDFLGIAFIPSNNIVGESCEQRAKTDSKECSYSARKQACMDHKPYDCEVSLS